MVVNILGTEWLIRECAEEDCPSLRGCDGLCDNTAKEIIIAKQRPTDEVKKFEVHRKRVMRHEILHAFLFESGLGENFEHPKWGHDEIMVDWVAYQFPKLNEAFRQAGCI